MGCGPEGLAQGHEGPGRRAIAFTIGRAARFGEDPIAVGHRLGRRRATAMPRHQAGEAMLIEARHQVRDGIPGAAPGRLGRSRIALPIRNGEERFGARHMAGRFSV